MLMAIAFSSSPARRGGSSNYSRSTVRCVALPSARLVIGFAVHSSSHSRTRSAACWRIRVCRRPGGRRREERCSRRGLAARPPRVAGCCGPRRSRRSGSTCATRGCRDVSSSSSSRMWAPLWHRRAHGGSLAPQPSKGGSIPERCWRGVFCSSALCRFVVCHVVAGCVHARPQRCHQASIAGRRVKLDPDETRHQGVGQHLARVMESGSVEGLALAGGFYALTAFFDLFLAATILDGVVTHAQLAALLIFVGWSVAWPRTTFAFASDGPRHECG